MEEENSHPSFNDVMMRDYTQKSTKKEVSNETRKTSNPRK